VQIHICNKIKVPEYIVAPLPFVNHVKIFKTQHSALHSPVQNTEWKSNLYCMLVILTKYSNPFACIFWNFPWRAYILSKGSQWEEN